MYAYWYLRRCGYVMVACLFMVPGINGKIDLDGDDSAVLVLVGGEDAPGESPGFGKPENAVTPEKRRNLARRARHFLAERRIREAACRLDVLAIESRTGRRPLVRLPKGAFGAKGKRRPCAQLFSGWYAPNIDGAGRPEENEGALRKGLGGRFA